MRTICLRCERGPRSLQRTFGSARASSARRRGSSPTIRRAHARSAPGFAAEITAARRAAGLRSGSPRSLRTAKRCRSNDRGQEYVRCKAVLHSGSAPMVGYCWLLCAPARQRAEFARRRSSLEPREPASGHVSPGSELVGPRLPARSHLAHLRKVTSSAGQGCHARKSPLACTRAS